MHLCLSGKEYVRVSVKNDIIPTLESLDLSDNNLGAHSLAMDVCDNIIRIVEQAPNLKTLDISNNLFPPESIFYLLAHIPNRVSVISDYQIWCSKEDKPNTENIHIKHMYALQWYLSEWENSENENICINVSQDLDLNQIPSHEIDCLNKIIRSNMNVSNRKKRTMIMSAIHSNQMIISQFILNAIGDDLYVDHIMGQTSKNTLDSNLVLHLFSLKTDLGTKFIEAKMASNSPEKAFILGHIHYRNRAYEQACTYMEKAAEANIATAHIHLIIFREAAGKPLNREQTKAHLDAESQKDSLEIRARYAVWFADGNHMAHASYHTAYVMKEIKNNPCRAYEMTPSISAKVKTLDAFFKGLWQCLHAVIEQRINDSVKSIPSETPGFETTIRMQLKTKLITELRDPMWKKLMDDDRMAFFLCSHIKRPLNIELLNKTLIDKMAEDKPQQGLRSHDLTQFHNAFVECIDASTLPTFKTGQSLLVTST